MGMGYGMSMGKVELPSVSKVFSLVSFVTSISYLTCIS